MSELAPGNLTCIDHAQPALWCPECVQQDPFLESLALFWLPCCGERHVCLEHVAETRAASLKEGEWADIEERTADYKAATERSRRVREDLGLTPQPGAIG